MSGLIRIVVTLCLRTASSWAGATYTLWANGRTGGVADSAR